MGLHLDSDHGGRPHGGETPAPAAPGDYRVDLPLAGRAVLVVGGGAVALGRVAGLRTAGALVTVVAPAPVAALVDLAERGAIVVHRRELTVDDLDHAVLVVTATGDPDSDAAVAEAAARAGRLSVGVPGRPAARPSDGAAVGPRLPVGRVVLVGGGPGDPGLITVAGMQAVTEADVLVVDRLAPLAVLAHIRPRAQVVDVSKIPSGPATPQEEINRLLVEHARAGRMVVRLKGGDSFVFGRGGEEWQHCVAAGVPVQVIPGVSSATAAPALAGIPVTHRSLGQGYTVVSAHVPPGDPRSTLDWAALARAGTALVILMGLRTLPDVTAALIGHGMDPATPAASVADAGLPSQRKVAGTLDTIADLTARAGLRPPAVTVIGAVAGFDPRRPD